MHLQALQHQHLVGEGLLDEATEGEIDNLFVKEFVSIIACGTFSIRSGRLTA
jgi:hypothetical protein